MKKLTVYTVLLLFPFLSGCALHKDIELTEADKHFMRLATAETKKGIAAGQTPFGACIVKDRKIIVCAHNIVWGTKDITAHAEINAIRQACKKLNTIDLSGCTIYSTTEPCPMCFSACHWAMISEIIFGTSIRDAQQAGFNELTISNEKMKKLGNSQLKIVTNFLKDENLELFKRWSNLSTKRVY